MNALLHWQNMVLICKNRGKKDTILRTKGPKQATPRIVHAYMGNKDARCLQQIIVRASARSVDRQTLQLDALRSWLFALDRNVLAMLTTQDR